MQARPTSPDQAESNTLNSATENTKKRTDSTDDSAPVRKKKRSHSFQPNTDVATSEHPHHSVENSTSASTSSSLTSNSDSLLLANTLPPVASSSGHQDHLNLPSSTQCIFDETISLADLPEPHQMPWHDLDSLQLCGQTNQPAFDASTSTSSTSSSSTSAEAAASSSSLHLVSGGKANSSSNLKTTGTVSGNKKRRFILSEILTEELDYVFKSRNNQQLFAKKLTTFTYNLILIFEEIKNNIAKMNSLATKQLFDSLTIVIDRLESKFVQSESKKPSEIMEQLRTIMGSVCKRGSRDNKFKLFVDNPTSIISLLQLLLTDEIFKKIAMRYFFKPDFFCAAYIKANIMKPRIGQPYDLKKLIREIILDLKSRSRDTQETSANSDVNNSSSVSSSAAASSSSTSFSATNANNAPIASNAETSTNIYDFFSFLAPQLNNQAVPESHSDETGQPTNTVSLAADSSTSSYQNNTHLEAEDVRDNPATQSVVQTSDTAEEVSLPGSQMLWHHFGFFAQAPANTQACDADDDTATLAESHRNNFDVW